MMATEAIDETVIETIHRSTKASDVDASEFPELLKQYYDRLFPYSKYFRWLSYGDKHTFSHREFSFTLKDDVYIRYKSYETEEEMTKDIKKTCPYKIDIGAVFSTKPKDRLKSTQFKPMEKELVFDIDMTDYDEIRTCCSGAAICAKCWPFMQVAAKIIDNALREDFGFSHMLWVYSGRRGIHCWVCDKRARALSNDQRSAVAEWLSVVVGGEQKARQVNLNSSVHPSIERALDIAKKFFDDVVINSEVQDVLNEESSISKLLAVISDDDIEKKLKDNWKQNPGETSEERWKELCDEIKKAKQGTAKKAKNHNMTMRRQEIILQYSYPRLDINVSKQLNHLLKSPFVVHPKTGRVCTPFDIEEVDSFDPFTVPTITDLMSELDNYASEAMDTDVPIKNVDKTSLKASIEVFTKFLNSLDKDTNVHKKAKRVASEMDAANTGDW